MIKIPQKGHVMASTTAYWQDFLTGEDINTILTLPNWNNITNASIVGQQGNVFDENKRRSEIAWFFPCEKTDIIWNKIVNAISEVNRHYFHFDLTECAEGGQLTQYSYKKNQESYYNWHIDMNPKCDFLTRKLSMSLLLSDTSEFEGGSLQVKENSDIAVDLEQKKGRAWFFPSYTLHRVAPVTKGTRKSLVIWAGGPSFR